MLARPTSSVCPSALCLPTLWLSNQLRPSKSSLPSKNRSTFSCASIPIPQNPQKSLLVSTRPTASLLAPPSNFPSTASATSTPSSPSLRPPNLRLAISPSPPTPSAATKNSPP